MSSHGRNSFKSEDCIEDIEDKEAKLGKRLSFGDRNLLSEVGRQSNLIYID